VKHGALAILLCLAACERGLAQSDQPDATPHSVLGTGERLRDVQNPQSPAYAGPTGNVNVSSIVVTAIDNFDETHNGKSIGTVFVQDVDQVAPYAGISMYGPTFTPSNLRLVPGDVVNMTGDYTEQTTIGTSVNFAPAFLPQMNKPQVDGTESYEAQIPQPMEIQLSDLTSFSTGRQWIGMLVTIKNVTLVTAPTGDGSGRVTAALTSGINPPEINNELWDLEPNAYPAGTTFTSITGVVDFFFNLFVCPRSADDLQQ